MVAHCYVPVKAGYTTQAASAQQIFLAYILCPKALVRCASRIGQGGSEGLGCLLEQQTMGG